LPVGADPKQYRRNEDCDRKEQKQSFFDDVGHSFSSTQIERMLNTLALSGGNYPQINCAAIDTLDLGRFPIPHIERM